MSNKLKSITTRAKQLKKKHPGTKWTNLIKKAARELKAGKTKNPNPIKTKKRKRAKRTVNKVAAVKKVSAPRRRKAKVYKVTHKVRRVGAAKNNFALPLLLVGGGLLAFALLRKKTATTAPGSNLQQYPAIRYTGNAQRDTTADQIVKYAQAAGYASDAIIKLINALNSATDSEVEGLKEQIDYTEQIPSNWV